MNRPLLILSGRDTPGTLTAMEEAVVARWGGEGWDCLLIPHLYHLSETSACWAELAVRAGPGVLLCRLHPRPAQWILRRHGITDPGLSILDLNGFSDADSAFAAARDALPASALREPAGGAASPPGRVERFQEPVGQRWYPVVDGLRCQHCGHCLQFCLFGVYEMNAEGKVLVRHPDNCKPGCPACSRVCPHGAIMFPLYDRDPAIAGAPGQLLATGTDACDTPAGRSPSPAPPPFDDLDALVEQLDRRMQGRP
jgi:hypothetical protein